MGNSASRPGCLGQKSRRPEEPPGPDGGCGAEPHAGKAPTENGWSAAGPRRSPVLQRSLSEAAVQNGSTACVALRARGREGAAVWTPPRAPRGPRSWQPVSAREVTEVTEVTETIVTEIVEVTQYPAGGDAAGTRTGTATLTDGTDGHEVTPQAVPVPEDTPEALLAWVADMEELVGNQRPPAADVKVAKAQLEEQKLLRRLLEERRPRVERGLQDEPNRADVAALRQRWGRLLKEVQERFVFLERIVPAAQRFQQGADSFQEWLAATERLLAQLWGTKGCGDSLRDAHRQGQTLCEEIRARLPELQDVLERGQCVLHMVTGEEAALAQERLEWLRMRYLIAAQSTADTEQRMAQAMDASSRVGPAQEDLQLWLGRVEAELNAWDGREPPCNDQEKLQQFLHSELDRLAGLQERLDAAGSVQLDMQALDAQLAEHKLLSAEILHHRSLVERLLGVAEPMLSCCPESMQQRMEPSVQALREHAEQLWQRSGARSVQLEQAQALLAQFCEAHTELQPWLEETQAAAAQLCPDAISCDAFREQQALLQCLREAVAEHRPLVAKLRRVAAQLQELSPEQAAPLQQRCEEAEERYGRIRERMQRAAAMLEDALPRYGQLSERMDLLRECMERLQGRLQGCPPLHGDAAQLRERLRENSVAVAELQQMGAALQAVRAQCDELRDSMRAAGCNAAATALQDRAAQLQSQWGSLRAEAEAAELRLQELQALAERFWGGAAELALTLADTQRLLLRMEGEGGEPEGISARLQSVQALQEELEALQAELQALRCVGAQLMEACGDAAAANVSKGVEELCSSWHSLHKVWSELRGRLQEQLHHALSYRDSMERLSQWVDAAELRVAEEFLIGGDPDVVQQQLQDLKDFKRDLYQCRVDAECLQPPGGPTRGDPPPQLLDFRRRWDHLEEEIVGRQHQLEAALLGLGQFQQQLAALLQWLSHTAEQLQSSTAPCCDLQSCEVEMAKHRVLQNDVQSHARSVQSVSDAGQGLLQCSAGDGAEGLQRSLQELQQRWDTVCTESERRQLQLQHSLGCVQDVTAELTELLQWLESVEMQLCCCRMQCGDPESTKEELNAHLELCKALDSKLALYHSIRERLQELQSCSPTVQPCSTEHRLRLLEHKWESVQEEAQERKQRLSEALSLSTELHGAVQELQHWLQRTERLLSGSTASCIRVEGVDQQILQLQTLQDEAAARRAQLGGLEAAALRLEGLSRRRDGAGGQSAAVRDGGERLRALRDGMERRAEQLRGGRRRCEEFWEARRLLLQFLQDAELRLQEPQGCIGGSREETKRSLEEHKLFQRTLRSKRPLLDAALRCGRALLDSELQHEDMQQMQEMLQEMKRRWEELCSHSAERQHALEQNLLFSGRLSDALQALLDWLYRMEPQLCDEAPVGGDRDLVSNLMDKHKVFQKELGKRASCMKMLKRSVRELTRSSSSSGGGGGGVDAQWLQLQMEELSVRWDAVCRMSVCKQGRLEAALRQAEEFHTLVHSFLGRLSESEKSLKYSVYPEEERAVQEGQQQLQELLQSLQCQQLELECITSLGEEILSMCHPDSVITIKSWLTVAKSRFQEVQSCLQQQEQRLRAQQSRLEAEREELQRLQLWMAAAEEALSERDGEPLPECSQLLRELSRQHAEFMEELNRKQDDVDKATKGCREKLSVELSAATARRGAARRRSSPKVALQPAAPLVAAEPPPPVVSQLLQRWQQLWLSALQRQYRLETAMQRLQELEEFSHFDFGQWRQRFLQWISQMKSRVLDVFRSIDRDQDGRISLREFMDSLLSSKFPTNTLEMTAVANIFDTNGDGFIDYCEFVSALHPNRDPQRRGADADRIQAEVNRQVAQCNCAKRFQVEQISANRYRFGESQQLRMVRILRSTLMVRVGGGWIALDEFLVKNDPCRVKGRTNVKINEKYLSPDAFGAAAKCSGIQSAPSSKALSPSRSNSSLSLYSSASAPSSPLARKSVQRRTRSGDRCPRTRGSLPPDGAELRFSAAEESPDAAPPEPPDGSPPERRSPCR